MLVVNCRHAGHAWFEINFQEIKCANERKPAPWRLKSRKLEHVPAQTKTIRIRTSGSDSALLFQQQCTTLDCTLVCILKDGKIHISLTVQNAWMHYAS